MVKSKVIMHYICMFSWTKLFGTMRNNASEFVNYCLIFLDN